MGGKNIMHVLFNFHQNNIFLISQFMSRGRKADTLAVFTLEVEFL